MFSEAFPSEKRRILALDVGARRIGLAISDPLGVTAQGLATLERRNQKLDWERLQRLIEEHAVAEMVVGYPLRMSGAAGTEAGKIAAFADQLRRRFHLPVHLWDERLSSAEANRVLRQTGMSSRRRAQVVDGMAAVLILQSFLDARGSRNEDLHHGDTETRR